MLDFIGTVVVTTVMVVAVNSIVSSLAVSRAQRIGAAVTVGLWIGLAAASATAGLLGVLRPFPYVGLFVGVPIVAVAALAALSPSWRLALIGLPTPLLVGLNVSRIFGALFLVLAAQERLSGPFPASAGWGDIATGLLALPALWLATRRPLRGQPLLMGWNVLGALDLIVAITLGVTSTPGSPLQVLDVGVGSTAMQFLPWALIPTVLVPFYLIVHGILFVQLRQTARQAGRDRLVARMA
jgi:hypothetical protein